MDNDDLESLVWIEDDDKAKRLAKLFYIEQMIAELEIEEKRNERRTTENH